MKVAYSVTFESLVHPPETIKGTVEASTIHTLAARAVKQAKKAKPTKHHWCSMVLVIEKSATDAAKDEPNGA